MVLGQVGDDQVDLLVNVAALVAGAVVLVLKLGGVGVLPHVADVDLVVLFAIVLGNALERRSAGVIGEAAAELVDATAEVLDVLRLALPAASTQVGAEGFRLVEADRDEGVGRGAVFDALPPHEGDRQPPESDDTHICGPD